MVVQAQQELERLAPLAQSDRPGSPALPGRAKLVPLARTALLVPAAEKAELLGTPGRPELLALLGPAKLALA